MKKYILILFVLITVQSYSQNKIDWSEENKLTKKDYLATAPNTGYQQTVLGNFFIGFQIDNYSLMFSKNLNKYVSCYFQKDASYIDEGDSVLTKKLLRYQQLIFDTYELSARKLRQKFYEEKKRLMAEVPNKLQEEVLAENTRLLSRIERETSHGINEIEIEKWELWTNNELTILADYCKTCKPKKKPKTK